MKTNHQQTSTTLNSMLSQITGVSNEEVGSELLALQTRMQASMQTTSHALSDEPGELHQIDGRSSPKKKPRQNRGFLRTGRGVRTQWPSSPAASSRLMLMRAASASGRGLAWIESVSLKTKMPRLATFWRKSGRQWVFGAGGRRQEDRPQPAVIGERGLELAALFVPALAHRLQAGGRVEQKIGFELTRALRLFRDRAVGFGCVMHDRAIPSRKR